MLLFWTAVVTPATPIIPEMSTTNRPQEPSKTSPKPLLPVPVIPNKATPATRDKPSQTTPQPTQTGVCRFRLRSVACFAFSFFTFWNCDFVKINIIVYFSSDDQHYSDVKVATKTTPSTPLALYILLPLGECFKLNVYKDFLQFLTSIDSVLTF